MSDPIDAHGASRQPTDQELRNVTIQPERMRVVNLITFAFVAADVIVLGLAVWFFMGGNELIAYVLLGYILLNILFVFWFRKLQIRQAKLQAWKEDPLNQTL